MITMTYIGRRKNGNHLRYAYLTDNEESHYQKPIVPAAIGYMFTCETTEKGVKGPYTPAGKADWKLITQWSVEELAAKEKVNALKTAKIIPDSHIDTLIKSVKDNTSNYTDRKRIALYIFEKILS